MGQFADLLNSAIDEARLTAAEVAESSGLTESAISLLRAGRREPSYRTLQRLANVFPSLGEQLGRVGSPFDSIEGAIADIRAGKMVVFLDDEDRENEGDV
ncbi:MAG: helix-turn-helix domain-containing protein, partial [Candidatus Cybelea sp.]